MKVIGITGLIGSGKDTVARVFELHGYKKLSFADSLKDCVSAIFGWDRKKLEGENPKDRRFRNTLDPFWTKKFGFTVTPRYIMQYFGTEVCREHFLKDIWIASLENKLEDKNVITDVRFQNEYDFVKSNGGSIIRVVRNTPKWYNDALKAVEGDSDAVYAMKLAGVHESEWRSVGFLPDVVINNNKDITALNDIVNDMIPILEKSK